MNNRTNNKHLDDVKQRLSHHIEKNPGAIHATKEEIREDILKVLYYVNGVEVFRNKKSEAVDFKTLLNKTDEGVSDFINQHFNRSGFKGIAEEQTRNHLFREMYRSTITITNPHARYDFIEQENGVICIERYTCFLHKQPLCLGMTTFMITNDENGPAITIEDDKIYLIEPQKAEKLFANDNKEQFQFEETDGKSCAELLMNYNQMIIAAVLSEMFKTFPETLQDRFDDTMSEGEISFPKLKSLVEGLLTHRVQEIDAAALEKIQTLLKSEIIPCAEELENQNTNKFLAALVPVFYKVFPCDSHVIDSEYFNYEWIGYANPRTHEVLPRKHKNRMMTSIKKYYLHPLTMAASFLGLPNWCELGETPSAESLFRNFLGFEQHKTRGRNAVNLLLILFSVAKNLILFALSTPYNLIRLFTEFLPAAIAQGFKSLAEIAAEKSAQEKISLWQKRGYVALKFFSLSLSLLFDGIFVLGRAVTSPIKSIEAAFDFGRYFRKGKNESRFQQGLRVFAGMVLVLLSAGLTVTAYTLLFPLIFNALPVIGLDLPAYLSSFLDVALPILADIGGAVVMPILGEFALLIGLTPVMAGFTLMAGILIATAGVMLSEALDLLKELWRVTCYRKETEEAVVLMQKNEAVQPTHHKIQKKLKSTTALPLKNEVQKKQENEAEKTGGEVKLREWKKKREELRHAKPSLFPSAENSEIDAVKPALILDHANSL
jgi:hypothetical protein